MNYDTNFDGWTDVDDVDSDGDGIADIRYVDSNYDGRFDMAYVDSDEDGWVDAIAYDLDEDGVADVTQSVGGVLPGSSLISRGGGGGGSTWEQDQMNAIDGNLDDLDQMIDGVISDIDSGHLDIGGHYVDGVYISPITQDVTGFINDGGAKMSDVIGTVLNGDEFTPEQLDYIERTIANGERLEIYGNIMEVNDRIMNSWNDQEQRRTFGYLQEDSYGNVWHWNPHTGEWDAVRYDAVRDVTIFEPSPYTPPFARG